MKSQQTDVLIVGGGGAGLTASMLLAGYGVGSILINDRPTTSRLPKAHMLNQRSMEIFDEVGLAETVYEHGTPADQMRATGWYSGVVSPHTDHFRLIGKIEAWGCGYTDPEYVAASPCRSANLPQLNLEPLMRERAEEMSGPEAVRFHHELISFEQDADGVEALVRDRDVDRNYSVHARYMIAADAGRTIGPSLGIELVGDPPTVQMVTLFLSADLSEWAREEDVVSWHLITPEMDSTLESGTLLAAGPERWGGHSEQWYFHLMYPLGDAAAFDDEGVMRRMRTVLGLPDLEVEVHVINRWTIYSSLADRFRAGRVFLVGDAAHRNPPMGGLGLNSAIGDVHNLCWKLAAALQGLGGERLLESYEAERRPFCDAVIRRALENSRRSEGLHEAIGMSPENSLEDNWQALESLWEDAGAAERRRRVRGILQRQSMDFRDLNIEVGLAYGASPGLVGAGRPGPDPVDPIRVYQPTTIPGHPLPHAWVEDGTRRVSLRDLCAGRWLLVCGEDAADWRDAALELARIRGIPLEAIQVGHAAGDWFDPRCAWIKQRQVAPGGCVLARPDRYVAWRTPDGSGDPATVLAEVLGRLLPA